MSLKQLLINEYSYDKNMGFEEMMLFYDEAPNDLIQKVEKLIDANQDKSAWKIIQDFLGTKLKGNEFN